MVRLLVAVASAVLAFSSHPLRAQSDSTPAAQLPSVTLPPELARVLTDYETTFEKRDAKARALLFTTDGYVLAGGRPPVKGREAIEELYEGTGGSLALRAIAYAAEGSTAYIIGGYARKKGDPDDGKFTLTLRKEGDRWLIVSDMDNTNKPPRRPGS
jgi:ketosteroid isomerase-like protein